MTRMTVLAGAVAMVAVLIAYQSMAPGEVEPAGSADIPRLTVSHRTTGQAPEPFRFDPPKASADAIAAVRFENAKGQAMGLAAFRGKHVLLNIWATWCAPCREEMPTLDRAQAQLGSDRFQVVALSIDLAGQAPVREFYDDLGLAHLDIYVDATGMAAFQLGVAGIPATLLLDAEGRELARYLGRAEWDSAPVVAAIRGHLPP